MHKMLKGNKSDIISANVRGLKAQGMSHAQATHLAMKHANKGTGKTIAKKVAKYDLLKVR